MLAKDPDVVPILQQSRTDLKRNVLPILSAGMAHARSLGQAKLAAIWSETGTDRAWDAKFQNEADALHARGKLFVGDRKEDTPYGQETEPAELEESQLAVLPNAPPKPVYKPKSPQALYILAVRGSIKMAQGLKTLKEAETIAKVRWAVLPKVQKEPWEKMKKA